MLFSPTIPAQILSKNNIFHMVAEPTEVRTLDLDTSHFRTVILFELAVSSPVASDMKLAGLRDFQSRYVYYKDLATPIFNFNPLKNKIDLKKRFLHIFFFFLLVFEAFPQDSTSLALTQTIAKQDSNLYCEVLTI